MYRAASVTFLFLLYPFVAGAQIFPAEGIELNYRIIGFSFSSVKGATDYRLEIASGTQTTEEAFNKNIIRSTTGKVNRLTAEVPFFGSRYTWRTVSVKNNAVLSYGELHHFSTGAFCHTDSLEMRLRIENKASKYADAFVFLNANNALYDMEGNPVWYLPHTNELQFTDKTIRDLKITDRGTITFIAALRDAYEIDYNGTVLWKAPNDGSVSGDSSESYNHELTRLANGNYMILGTEIVRSQGSPAPPPAMNGARTQHGTTQAIHKQPFGTVIEYDAKGKIVWTWRSASHFQRSGNTYPATNDIHQNSFYFDEKNKAVYLSYKNIHRVLKVKYPEGTVLKTYGATYKPGAQTCGTGAFCFQHSINGSADRMLYLFNNNSCNPGCTPEILMLREPAPENGGLEMVWNFAFPVPPLATLLQNREGPGAANTGRQRSHRDAGIETTGGNVTELPDESMFASLCAPYSSVYIVSKEKKILWSAVAEIWNREEKNWVPLVQYRASIIPGRNELEKLIWYNSTIRNN